MVMRTQGIRSTRTAESATRLKDRRGAPVSLNAYRWHRAAALLLIILALAGSAVTAGPSPAYASTITRTSSSDYYIDAADGLVSGYASYQVTSSSDYADMWVTIGSFTGNVGLSDNAPNKYQIGAISNGETKTAFFFLKAATTTSTAQTHQIKLYSGNPDKGGVELQAGTFTLNTVSDVIAANANKVTGGTVTFSPPELSQPITLTIDGESGTIGSSKLLVFTPAAKTGWNATAFKMTGSTITLSGGNTGTYTDTLAITVPNTSNTTYRAVYTFRATSTTSSETPIYPIAHISSGTQIKHTSTGNFVTLPPVPAVVNYLALTVSASPTSLEPGGTVTYTVTITNSGSQAATLSSLAAALSSGFGYAPGTSQYNGSAIGDPALSGQNLTYTGPFTIPTGTSRTLTFNVTAPSTTGTYTTSASLSAILSDPAVQIDKTADTNDNNPATASVTIAELVAPNITGLDPSSGKVGAAVTIAGSGFTGTTSVTFNGTASTFTVTSDTSITTTVPSGATTGDVVVTNSKGSGSKSFTVIPAPTITKFTPASGAPGDVVAIEGTNFTSATSVKFNGTSATFAVLNDSTISATIPGGAGSGTISVTTPGGTGTSADNFSIEGAPTITSFTPTSGVRGAAVTITGTRFTGATKVKFGAVEAGSFTVVDATKITTAVPDGAVTSAISVITPEGTGTSADSFTVPAPVITGLSPGSGIVGATVTITGSNFTDATNVKFNGVSAAAAMTVVDNSTITAKVPDGAGTGKVSVTTAAGTGTSADDFTVIGAPTVTKLTPSSGVPGTLVTINGTDLTGATSVKFGALEAKSFAVISGNTITATVPAGTTTALVSVTTLAGTGISADDFTVPAPVITKFTPASAAAADKVTISGSSLTGATSVKFGGTESTSFSVDDDSTITAVVPSGATDGKISVTTPGGTATSGATFSLASLPPSGGGAGGGAGGGGGGGGGGTVSTTAPVISTVSVASGTPGTSLTITGTNFTGATAVSFGGVASTSFTVLNDGAIVVTVPFGAANGAITVQCSNGTAVTASTFSVTGLPAITSFTPQSGGNGTVVTISGTNFTGAVNVTIGDMPVTSFTVIDDNTITAIVSDSITGAIVVTTGNGIASTQATNPFSVNQISASVISSSPGAVSFSGGVANVGSFQVGNTSKEMQTLNEVTIQISDHTFFASGTLTATASAGTVIVTATINGPAVTFTFPTPLTLQPGEVATISLSMVSSGIAAGSPSKGGGLATLFKAGSPLLALMLILSIPKSTRRGLMMLMVAGILAWNLSGCSAGGGAFGYHIDHYDLYSGGGSTASSPKTATVIITRITGQGPRGEIVNYSNLPVQVGSVTIDGK
ncbi:MAG: IPT/TIG domain-containing protein [Candidatus Eremiobacteraeota bacterium]|nr:IPT/TIG domain-containing protein [Candidatus Eremiobacteraeota bacterium]